MKKLKFFPLIFVTIIMTAQHKILVIDSISRQPVQYASIWNGKKIFTNVDSIGYFGMDKANQVYKIAAIGFEDKKVIKLQDTILLKPKVFLLDEVIVSRPKFLKSIKYGRAKKGQGGATNFDAKDSQMVKYIPGNSGFEGAAFLKTISFYTEASSNRRKVNIIFYSIGKDGSPGE